MSDPAGGHEAGDPRVGLGDWVSVRTTPATIEAGCAGKVGQIHGWTTVSVTRPVVIGDPVHDQAVNVNVGEKSGFWIVPELVEFVRHDTLESSESGPP